MARHLFIRHRHACFKGALQVNEVHGEDTVRINAIFTIHLVGRSYHKTKVVSHRVGSNILLKAFTVESLELMLGIVLEQSARTIHDSKSSISHSSEEFHRTAHYNMALRLGTLV
jgi:hypothetical protein